MYSNKWVSLLAVSAIMMFESSCQDWGQQDPLAGNQTYPTLQTVETFDFEGDGLDPVMFRTTASTAGVVPEVVTDDVVQSQVLSLNGGSVSFTNPLTAVSVQNAVSYTFWYKQNLAYETDADGNATETALGLDTEGAIFGWKNQNSTASAFITPNLWISYNGLDGEWEDNNPSDYATGYITPGEWHYVAIIIRDNGYGVYVDGDKKTDQVVTDFDMSKLVQFLAQAPTMTIGSGNDVEPRAFEIDDLTFYRNEITSKQIATPKKGSIGGGSSSGDSVDLSKWILVGNEDNTSTFWSAWSDYVNLTGDGVIHYEFYNYGGPSNWNYWGLVITNGLNRDADGYTEYLFLRCDNYGWASLYDQTTLENDYDFDTYATEMNGAYVVMDITRKGTTVYTSSVITCTSGNVYHYKSTTTGVENETIGTFFTCDNSHYLFNPDATFVGQTYESGTHVTGATDYTTGWWSAFSDLYTFDSSFTKWGVEFINGNSGSASNWNNWLLVCTNGKAYGDDGYSENYVLRADAYGWGTLYDSSTMTQSFDWTTYVEDMHNATCRVYFDYTNSKLTMVCRQTKEDGTAMPEYRFETPGVAAPVGLFFTCELAYVDFLKVGYFPWVDMDPQE